MSGFAEKEAMQAGYRSIALAANETDAIAAYTEFDALLEELAPDADTVLSTAKQQSKILEKIMQRVRQGAVNLEGVMTPYFAGSGIILVGDSAGQILAGSYKGKDDPVAEYHGTYQYEALRKLGQAALLGHTIERFAPSRTAYWRLEEILLDRGLSSHSKPHHMGYAFIRHSDTAFVTAAASGMLPTQPIADDIERNFRTSFTSARLKEWYTWEKDAAAGLHDSVAAYSVLAGWQKHELLNPEHSETLVKLTPMDFPNANIH